MEPEEWMGFYEAYKSGRIMLVEVPRRPVGNVVHITMETTRTGDDWETDRQVSAYFDKLYLGELGIKV